MAPTINSSRTIQKKKLGTKTNFHSTIPIILSLLPTIISSSFSLLQPYYPFQPTSNVQQLSSNSPFILSPSSNNATLEPIFIEFTCTSHSTLSCDNIRSSLERLKLHLQNIIHIKKQIRIYVGIIKKCEAAETRFMTSAFPTYFVHEENDPDLDPNYVYPPALAKQLSGKPFDNNLFDFKIAINPRASKLFWFKESDVSIGNHKDVDILLLHDALHGLGFANSLKVPCNFARDTGLWPSLHHFMGAFSPFSSILGHFFPFFFLTIPKNIVLTVPDIKEKDLEDTKVKAQGPSRPSIFDKYVKYTDQKGDKHSMLSFWQKVASYCFKKGDVDEYLARIADSPIQRDAETQYKELSYPNRTFMDLGTTSLPLIPLNPNSFMCGLSHFDIISTETVMSFSITPGLTLEKMVQNNNGSWLAAIGRPTIDVLRKIGYHIVGEKAPTKETFEKLISVDCKN